MSWKESEEELSHTYFVQPKGKAVSHVQDKFKVSVNKLIYSSSSL